MDVTILGGGLSSLSLAYNLQDKDNIDRIIIIEKESNVGGLCRSYNLNGINYDIGPHIIFSKDQEILEHMKWLLTNNYHTKRRSNKIIHKNTLVQYPFENDLSRLSDEDKLYAVNSFVHNPYENYKIRDMNQFFLKTFGEGITNLYLRPYNEKIWKFSPCFMNTMMVERIPKPPKEDILRSAQGETVDGYLHQLFFGYPDNGGMESIIKSYVNKFNNKIKIITSANIVSVSKEIDKYKVVLSNKQEILSDKLISTIPVNEFTYLYKKTPRSVKDASANLKYNSIMIAILQVSKDLSGDNFAFYVADPNIIFHRISKVNFLGDNYYDKDKTTYMAEITYRENDIYDKMNNEDILKRVCLGLEKIGFVDNETKILDKCIKRFKYAYVIYDMDYEKNIDKVRKYFDKEGIYLHGRFGNFEYINMDRAIKDSMVLSNIIK